MRSQVCGILKNSIAHLQLLYIVEFKVMEVVLIRVSLKKGLWFYAILLALLSSVATAEEDSAFTRQATAKEKAEGIKLAKSIVDEMGGMKAYNDIKVLSFDFVVTAPDGKVMMERKHYWDKHAGISHVVGKKGDAKLKAIIKLNEKTGDFWLDGKAVTDDKTKKELFGLAFSWWTNDSFWLVSPYKFFDQGVNLAAIDGQLRTTFEGVGLTPGDAYLYQLNDKNKIKGWKFKLQSNNLGDFQFNKLVKQLDAQFFQEKVSERFSISHGDIQASKSEKPELFK